MSLSINHCPGCDKEGTFGLPFKHFGLNFCSKECILYYETQPKSMEHYNFERFAFPMVRTIFPKMMAKELIDVQPMDGR